ncbi:hypothetical protein U1Q18_020533 [Sarracenia purpurea var. burkii]
MLVQATTPPPSPGATSFSRSLGFPTAAPNLLICSSPSKSSRSLWVLSRSLTIPPSPPHFPSRGSSLNSKRTLDLLSGQSNVGTGGESKIKKKNVLKKQAGLKL